MESIKNRNLTTDIRQYSWADITTPVQSERVDAQAIRTQAPLYRDALDSSHRNFQEAGRDLKNLANDALNLAYSPFEAVGKGMLIPLFRHLDDTFDARHMTGQAIKDTLDSTFYSLLSRHEIPSGLERHWEEVKAHFEARNYSDEAWRELAGAMSRFAKSGTLAVRDLAALSKNVADGIIEFIGAVVFGIGHAIGQGATALAELGAKGAGKVSELTKHAIDELREEGREVRQKLGHVAQRIDAVGDGIEAEAKLLGLRFKAEVREEFGEIKAGAHHAKQVTRAAGDKIEAQAKHLRDKLLRELAEEAGEFRTGFNRADANWQAFEARVDARVAHMVAAAKAEMHEEVAELKGDARKADAVLDHIGDSMERQLHLLGAKMRREVTDEVNDTKQFFAAVEERWDRMEAYFHRVGDRVEAAWERKVEARFDEAIGKLDGKAHDFWRGFKDALRQAPYAGMPS